MDGNAFAKARDRVLEVRKRIMRKLGSWAGKLSRKERRVKSESGLVMDLKPATSDLRCWQTASDYLLDIPTMPLRDMKFPLAFVHLLRRDRGAVDEATASIEFDFFTPEGPQVAHNQDTERAMREETERDLGEICQDLLRLRVATNDCKVRAKKAQIEILRPNVQDEATCRKSFRPFVRLVSDAPDPVAWPPAFEPPNVQGGGVEDDTDAQKGGGEDADVPVSDDQGGPHASLPEAAPFAQGTCRSKRVAAQMDELVPDEPDVSHESSPGLASGAQGTRRSKRVAAQMDELVPDEPDVSHESSPGLASGAQGTRRSKRVAAPRDALAVPDVPVPIIGLFCAVPSSQDMHITVLTECRAVTVHMAGTLYYLAQTNDSRDATVSFDDTGTFDRLVARIDDDYPALKEFAKAFHQAHINIQNVHWKLALKKNKKAPYSAARTRKFDTQTAK